MRSFQRAGNEGGSSRAAGGCSFHSGREEEEEANRGSIEFAGVLPREVLEAARRGRFTGDLN